MYFIGHLTLLAWATSILPRLIFGRIRRETNNTCCYVIEGSRFAFHLARISGKPVGITVKKLEYRLVDVHDERGLLISLRTSFQDLGQVQQQVISEPLIHELVRNGQLPDGLPNFLAKTLVEAGLANRNDIWPTLVLVQVSVWQAKKEGGTTQPLILFLERRPWFHVLAAYASSHGVTLIPLPAPLNLKSSLIRKLPPTIIEVLRTVRYRRFSSSSASKIRPATGGIAKISGPEEKISAKAAGQQTSNSSPRIAVESYGQFNLDHPEHHSDLFFWQQSSLRGSDLLVTFAQHADPLDSSKLDQLSTYGMAATALHPAACSIPGGPMFSHRRRGNNTIKLLDSIRGSGLEPRWLKNKITDYYNSRGFWSDLFDLHNVMVHVTWYKFGAHHSALADAVAARGGVATVYQRSYEPHPSPRGAVHCDIAFGFSPGAAEVERLSSSEIKYHVATGFLGDHRFPLLKEDAQRIRDQLQGNGAKRILAYYDENSLDDPHWQTGHEFMRHNYAFLLEKLLAEPWLGLAIKPKNPGTLRRRLGDIAPLLERALDTGRCYLFESGSVQNSYPPALAGLAADLAIHGHLCAGSAGMEAALAGVPTLLLDREGWNVSPLYRLGPGQVVFTEWQSLWEACNQHWNSSDGISGFGDWSAMLDELDPFRDGRAAERMGTYLQWLIEGFGAGLDRQTVMADAAERYCATWGSDKVTELNGRSDSAASSDNHTLDQPIPERNFASQVTLP